LRCCRRQQRAAAVGRAAALLHGSTLTRACACACDAHASPPSVAASSLRFSPAACAATPPC
jgi:hypothetical protein